MPRPQLTPGKDPVPIVQEAGRASGPVWTGAENLATTGIRSPNRPAHRQSLYRLRYPALIKLIKGSKFVPHVLKEISSSVKPNNSFGISLDNDINTSTCRLTEENNNTIIKNCDISAYHL
jgi:hypothetical protein